LKKEEKSLKRYACQDRKGEPENNKKMKQYEDKKINLGSEGKIRGRKIRKERSLSLSLTHTVYI